MTQFKEILEKERNRESSGDFNSIDEKELRWLELDELS